MIVLAVALLSLGALLASQQQEWSFPHTRSIGRATAEYRYQGFQVVINYDYSQRNHNTAWLLVDVATASRKRFVLHKTDIHLTTPDGRELNVAPQEQVIDNSPAITMLLQNAAIFRRQLTSYFNQRGQVEAIRFQTTPPGKGTVSDESTVDNDHVTTGAVLFKAPQGLWPSGTYRFAVDNDVAKAALSIKLE
jgi:hypothetical protein